MTGSKILAGSPSKTWHLILKLFSVFYWKFVDKFTGVCHIRVFFLKKLQGSKIIFGPTRPVGQVV